MSAFGKSVGVFLLFGFALIAAGAIKVNEKLAKNACRSLCQAENLKWNKGWSFDQEEMVLSCVCKSEISKVTVKTSISDNGSVVKKNGKKNEEEESEVSTDLSAGFEDIWNWYAEGRSWWAFNCDYNGGDIATRRVRDANECVTLCRPNPLCFRFTYVAETSMCTLKRQHSNPRYEYERSFSESININTICGYFESPKTP